MNYAYAAALSVEAGAERSAKPRRKSKTFAMDLPTVDVLAECFDLDMDGGRLFWRRRPDWHFTDPSYAQRWNDRWAGVEALTGRSGRGGPKQGTITIAGRQYHPQASRIVWTLVHGVPPAHELGHRNGDWSDNRPGNLVEVPSRDRILAVSMKRPGLRGAYKHRDGGYWSGITVDGQQVYLGHFDTDVEANAAWLAARAKREAQLRAAIIPNAFD